MELSQRENSKDACWEEHLFKKNSDIWKNCQDFIKIEKEINYLELHLSCDVPALVEEAGIKGLVWVRLLLKLAENIFNVQLS